MDKKTVHLPGIAPGGCLLFLKYPVWTGYFRRNRQKVKGIMKKIVKILRGIGYLAAFSLILYPVVSNYINQMNSTTIATDYEQEVSHLSEEQENAMIEQAQEYNESLIGIGSIADPFSESNENQTENDVYNNLLKIDDTGMMGYIDIPKLDVVLPVYHGTSEKVLQSGVGHLKNTSLPVGGESCHAVLSGHRGLANAKIFTDLNKMEVGDVFYIKVLHHTFAYQVDQILTVLPSDTDALQIEKGKDYVTLVTCTPYAVNTHRLLVRGTRIPYEEAQKIDEEVGLQRTIPFNLILLIAGIVALVRAYVKDNFVDKGMCADFAIHDKGTGNPHVHIMLTLRPLKENGQWGAKCRKAYDLDENGQRIPDGKGGWKNHREDTTDWNDKGNVEIWRAAWAAYTNRALESAGRPERIDHRSYKRQGIDKIPSVHLGPAASQMEKRGIRTDKGEVNRQIVADNKLLKEIKARITRLYRWSKAEAEKPQTQQSSLTALWEAQQQLNAPRTRTGKIRALQESAALFSFLQANGIQSMQQLHEKIADMNSRYYDLRGKIVKAERRIAILTERGEMWEQYNQYKSIHKQLAKVKPEKREQFEQRHSRELILYDAAARYLKELKDSGEGITPKAWQREIDQLAAGKQTDTLAMKSMREELKAVERLRKTAEQLSRQERDKSHDRGPER